VVPVVAEAQPSLAASGCRAIVSAAADGTLAPNTGGTVTAATVTTVPAAATASQRYLRCMTLLIVSDIGVGERGVLMEGTRLGPGAPPGSP
jgi:hypothetical protein